MFHGMNDSSASVVGIIGYALVALCAVWLPVAGLVITCLLPVFYGVTSGGWRRRTPPSPPGPAYGP